MIDVSDFDWDEKMDEKKKVEEIYSYSGIRFDRMLEIFYKIKDDVLKVSRKYSNYFLNQEDVIFESFHPKGFMYKSVEYPLVSFFAFVRGTLDYFYEDEKVIDEAQYRAYMLVLSQK